MKTKAKKFWKICGMIVFGIFLASFVFTNVVSLINYNNNKQYDAEITGIVRYQSQYNHIKVGVKTMDYNGCGIIAVYNILHMENKHQDLSKIVKDFDVYGLNGYGFFGTNPFAIMGYLANYGYKTNLYTNTEIFEEKAIESKYSLFLYATFNTGHYQLMFNYDGVDFETINSGGRSSMQEELDYTEDCFLKILITIK